MTARGAGRGDMRKTVRLALELTLGVLVLTSACALGAVWFVRYVTRETGEGVLGMFWGAG